MVIASLSKHQESQYGTSCVEILRYAMACKSAANIPKKVYVLGIQGWQADASGNNKGHLTGVSVVEGSGCRGKLGDTSRLALSTLCQPCKVKQR